MKIVEQSAWWPGSNSSQWSYAQARKTQGKRSYMLNVGEWSQCFISWLAPKLFGLLEPFVGLDVLPSSIGRTAESFECRSIKSGIHFI